MTKILSQSGQSLADIYDVEGSVAGIDQLETRELPIVHEMGQTVLSERFTTRIFRISSGTPAQNTGFSVEETNLPETPTRLLGLQVIATDPTELTRVAVLATDPTLGQDFPLWVWDTTLSLGEVVVLEDATVAVTRSILLPRPSMSVFPAFVGGKEQQSSQVSSVTLTGLTAGFGAGTTNVVALLYLAFPLRDINISSKGLPIPSW